VERIAIAIVILSLIPAAWVFTSNRDIPALGVYQDDGLFLINAKSLSEGRGYRILSLPGEPFQTKYQPLYPLLLSGVWRISPEFPRNLPWIMALQGAMFAALIAALGLFCRSLGIAPLQAAGCCALLALSPWVIYWAAIPVSDYLFAALVIAAFTSLRLAPGRGLAWFALTGALAAAAYMTKTAGLLIVPAIALSCCRRRDWRGALLSGIPVLAAVVAWTSWSHGRGPTVDHAVMWYYTDYAGAFVKNGGIAALPQIFPANLSAFIGACGNFIVHDMSESLAGRFLSVLAAAAMFTGGVRLWKRFEAPEYPLFCALLALLLCVWNFTPNLRLMLPLLPLLSLGIMFEIERVLALMKQSARAGGLNRIVAMLVLACGIGGLAYAVQANGNFIAHGLPAMLEHDRQRSARDRAAFKSIPPGAIVMTANDSLLYLDTGLKAVKPVPDSVAFYRQDKPAMLANFSHCDDLARAFGITHILIGPDDYATEFETGDRAEAIRLLRSNPRNHRIHMTGGYELLKVSP
jgi:hypothetical protein